MVLVADTVEPTWSKGIDGPTLLVAASPARRLRVCAGPGTGKTFALMRRVARLLDEDTEPDRILVVTFTRTAARDLISNLEKLGVPGSDEVEARTLHSLCFRIMSQSSALEVTGRFPRPLLEFEEAFLLRDLSNGERGVRDTKRLLQVFKADWARLQSDEPGWPSDPADKAFHRELIRWLRFHRGMLLDELITETRKYLWSNPQCTELAKYSHVLVDEYQDLNRSEQAVIDLLADQSNLMVIGDEDQSIYSGFRFAQPEGIRDFPSTPKGTFDQPLSVCRRCPRKIVDIVNSLISHNEFRESRSLEVFPGQADGAIEILQWQSLEEEASGVALRIEQYLTDPGTQRDDVLILTPRRVLGYQIRNQLNQKGIEAHSFFSEEALDNDLARERFTLLNLLAVPDDRVALRCWIGFQHHDWARNQYAALREQAETDAANPLETLDSLQNGKISIRYSSHMLSRLALLKKERTSYDGLLDSALVDQLFPAHVQELEQVRTLGYFAIEASPEAINVSRLFSYLRNRVIEPEPLPQGNFVRIMSLHKSKGLTAKFVVVAGCVEGWIPSLDSRLTGIEEQRHIEEQRRLFYVAVTRARESLTLSSFTSMPIADAYRMRIHANWQSGNRVYGLASRFLSELGPSSPRPKKG